MLAVLTYRIFLFLVTFGLMLFCLDNFVLKSRTVTKNQSVSWFPVLMTFHSRAPEYLNIYSPANPDARPFNASTFLVANFAVLDLQFPIVVYKKFDLISSTIWRVGSWEPDIIRSVALILRADPTLHLIDIGCNLGPYALVAAAIGRKVVAVDANIEMVERVWASIRRNHFGDRVTLLWNAISDRYDTFSVVSPRLNNVGHSFIVEPTDSVADKALLVKSILLDDLLHVISFKRAILKIDIEGHEWQAFRHAARLFEAVDITTVLMEWVFMADHKNRSYPLAIVDFFYQRNYRPFAHLSSTNPLKRRSFRSWPIDIVWKKM